VRSRIVAAVARPTAWANPRLFIVLAVTLVLVGLYPLLVRAANLILATSPAVSFSAEETGDAAEFPDSTAASTGFTSIPTARALFKEPRWFPAAQAAAPAAAATGGKRLALAIVGMPVDTRHAMLRGTKSRNLCLAPGSSRFSACNGNAQRYDRVERGERFTLCDYDADCWHSTAVALVALGSEGSPSPFARPGQQATTTFKRTTVRAVARQLYGDGGFSDSGQSFAAFLRERFADFPRVMNDPISLATLNFSGSTSKTTFVSRKMLFNRGISPGTPLWSVNVFREFGEAECGKLDREGACLLASTSAQEIALRELLEDADEPSKAGEGDDVRPGAVVIIAGGPLMTGPCDDNPTAERISELRKKGILTFVAAGNDGDSNRLRFPACASQAVAVGSLTRDGAIDRVSNGSKTRMVSLYVDGDVVAMPIRGPRIPATMGRAAGPGDCESFEQSGYCPIREPDDQYDLYLAGGTLLSTAVASGVYLDLRERFPTMDAEAVLTALRANTLPNNASAAEVNENAAASKLTEASMTAPPTERTSSKVTKGRGDREAGGRGNTALWVVLTLIAGAGGLILTVMVRRRGVGRIGGDAARG
jgi:subtilase family protein